MTSEVVAKLPGLRRGRYPQHVAEVVRFCELLPVPAGIYLGKRLKLLPWQRRFLVDLYLPRRPDGRRKVRQAVLSVARRQGKTLVCALLVLLHLVGPMRRSNGVIILAANDANQARTAFKLAADIIRLEPVLQGLVRIVDSTGRLVNQRDNIVAMTISAEANTKLGQGPDLVIYDEAGNAKNRELYDVLQTSLGSQPEPLMVLPSTQAAVDDHWFSELVDYGLQINGGVIDDPSFLLHLYSADEPDDPFVEETWRKANPALGYNRDLEDMRQSAERARAVPSFEPRFRNYLLNQRVQTEAPLLTPSVWKAGDRPIDVEVFRKGPVYGGLDLAARQDLASLVLVAEDEERATHVMTFAWTPQATLLERAHRDRAPYEVWAGQGHLEAVPGSSIGLDWVAKRLAELGSEFPIVQIQFDRWRIQELMRALDTIGCVLPLVECGQGFKDMSPAVEALEHAAIERQLVHGGNPVLRWCVANAVAQMDPAGNRKLNKRASYGRIDCAVALAMAMRALHIAREEAGVAETQGVLFL